MVIKQLKKTQQDRLTPGYFSIPTRKRKMSIYHKINQLLEGKAFGADDSMRFKLNFRKRNHNSSVSSLHRRQAVAATTKSLVTWCFT